MTCHELVKLCACMATTMLVVLCIMTFVLASRFERPDSHNRNINLLEPCSAED